MSRPPNRSRVPIGRHAVSLAVVMVSVMWASMVVAQQAPEPLTARIDRTEIALGEIVTLEIELPQGATGRASGPEGDDFQVVRQGMSTQMSIVNGRRTSSTVVTLMLTPTRTGDLTIGPVRVPAAGGVRSTPPFDVTVGEIPEPTPAPRQEASRPTRRDAPAMEATPETQLSVPAPLSGALFSGPTPQVPSGEPFFVATVTRPDVYVGQQVIVDFVLFTPSSTFGVEYVQLTEPEFSGVWFEDVTDARGREYSRGRLGSRRVGTELYDATVLRSYAVFPLEAGEVTIPSIEVELEFRGFTNRGRRRVRSLPLLLDVEPIPVAGRPAGFAEGNVGSLRVSAGVDRNVARVGDTINLTLAVNGSGLLSRVRLPELGDLDGARVFPADASHQQEVGLDLWMRGVSRSRVAIVPQEQGSLTIPSIAFEYFNPWTGAFETTQSDPITVTVAGQNPNALPVQDAPDELVERDWLQALPPPRPIRSSVSPLQGFGVSPVYGVLLLLPVCVLFGVVTVGATRRRNAATAPARAQGRAAATALAAMESGAPGDLAKAIREYIGTASGQAAGGMTAAALESHVASWLNASLAEQVRAVLDEADVARYGGATAPDLADRARAVVQAMEDSR